MGIPVISKTFIPSFPSRQGVSEKDPKVDLVAISYSPVAAKRHGDDDFWRECIPGDELDEPVKIRFTKYVLRCFHAKEKGFIEVEFETEDGRFLQQKLNRIAKLPVDKKNEERCDITQELSDRLSNKMTGASEPGAIFVIHAKVAGKTYVALIKLDFGQTEIVALKKAKAHRLFYEFFERALPEDASNFRKGVIIPSPGSGDARSNQFDALADYWQEFVGARPLREAKKAARAILEATEETLQEEGQVLTEAIVSKVLDEVKKRKAKDVPAVAAAIKAATGVKKKPEKIEDKLEEKRGRASFEEIAEVVKHIYTFSHHLRFSVPADLVRDGTVTVEEKDDGVLIRIRQSKLHRKDEFGSA